MRGPGRASRVEDVVGMFPHLRDGRSHRDLTIDPQTLPMGAITAVVGPSGSGKTTLLRDLHRLYGGVWTQDPVQRGDALVDQVRADLDVAIRTLARVGLLEPRLLVRPYDHLSCGEQFRARVAMALAAGAGPVFIDEYCHSLDRSLTEAVSSGLARWVRAEGVHVVVASVDEAIVAPLEPDVIIRLDGAGGWQRANPVVATPSLATSALIDEVDSRVWRHFAHFHYVPREDFAGARWFVARVDSTDAAIAVLQPYVQPKKAERHPALEDLNTQVTMVSRVVVHPRFRGLGLTRRLLGEALLRVGRPVGMIRSVLFASVPIPLHWGWERVVDASDADAVHDPLDRHLAERGFDPRQLLSEDYARHVVDELGGEREFPDLIRITLEAMRDRHVRTGFALADARSGLTAADVDAGCAAYAHYPDWRAGDPQYLARKLSRCYRWNDVGFVAPPLTP